MIELQPVSINGYNVYPFESIRELSESVLDVKKILIAINPEKFLRNEPELRDLLKKNIGYADGIGTIWALKRKGYRHVNRIPGVELWLEIISLHSNLTYYLVGAEPEINKKVVSGLQKQFKDIKIIGNQHGYLDSEKEKQLIDDIGNKKPDVVFVSMGSPKQELLIKKLHAKHEALYMGLGGSFDVYSGKVLRAPRFFQVLHLEWFFRLMKEPKRIKRQVILLKLIPKLIFNQL